MDLSKAFDCISSKLLVIKLHVHGVSLNAVPFMYPCLKNLKEKCKNLRLFLVLSKHYH